VPDRFIAYHATPVIFGDGVGELTFDAAFGRETGYDLGEEFIFGVLLFGRGDLDLTREAVTQRVHSGTFFPSSVVAPQESCAFRRFAMYCFSVAI